MADQWTGRSARQIALIICGCTTLCVFGIMTIWVLLHLLTNFSEQIPPLALLAVFIGLMLGLLSTSHFLVGLVIANDNIFCASGNPEAMTKALHKSFFLQGQIFLSILIVTTISVLMITKLVEVSQGLLIITGAVAFALGQNFVDRKNN
ncbi:MAG: hypothetical protein V1739_07325 [Candidatus Omnitrophota bacterium]